MTYIIDAIRTPIGNFGGTLKDVRTDDLGAIPIREIINRTGIDPSKINDVIDEVSRLLILDKQVQKLFLSFQQVFPK